MLLFYAKNESAESPKTQRLQCRSKKKAVPLGNNKHKQNLQIKNSLSLGGEMSRRDREGRLAINIDCPPTSPPISATAKQEPRKSRPPWGKEAGECLTEGGNSLSILDCPTTNAPPQLQPRKQNSTKSERSYNLASELPLSEPSRAHLSPKGEAYFCLLYTSPSPRD